MKKYFSKKYNRKKEHCKNDCLLFLFYTCSPERFGFFLSLKYIWESKNLQSNSTDRYSWTLAQTDRQVQDYTNYMMTRQIYAKTRFVFMENSPYLYLLQVSDFN